MTTTVGSKTLSPFKLEPDANNNLKRNPSKKAKRRKVITGCFLEQQSHCSIQKKSDIGVKSNGAFHMCVLKDTE